MYFLTIIIFHTKFYTYEKFIKFKYIITVLVQIQKFWWVPKLDLKWPGKNFITFFRPRDEFPSSTGMIVGTIATIPESLGIL